MAKVEFDGSRGDAGFGFVEKLRHVFHGREKETAPPAHDEETGVEALADLQRKFDSAIDEIEARVQSLSGSANGASGSGRHAPVVDRAAERQARLAELHDHMRADIEKMHVWLGSGIGSLDPILDALTELDQISHGHPGSHDFLGRARHAIAERLRREAGEPSFTRLLMLVERDGQGWPDPTHYRPHATEEEIVRSRRRRLAETREAFLAQDAVRIAERSVGIVTGWGTDYPDPGSPLWQECVLEGVGAGIRGSLCQVFLETLAQNGDALVVAIEDAVVRQLEGLRGQLDGGIRSVDDANRALITTLSAVDVVTPDIAWRLIVEKQPLARGEWGD